MWINCGDLLFEEASGDMENFFRLSSSPCEKA